MSNKTTFLFANPSFIYGVAHLLDFEGNFNCYNQSRTTLEADARAIYADWSVVGDELIAAMNVLGAQLGGKTL